MKNLQKFREEIDEIDRELVKLLEQRMNISLKIGEYKKENKLEIRDIDREEQIIKSRLKYLNNKHLNNYIIELLKFIMKISKDIQIDYMKKRRSE